MGQALYRNYRPRAFDEVVGQDHIIKTLKNALKSGKVSHAYLFTGPRGVGKTSVARILAHEVNDLKYSDETIHLDIIEIDAASNRRIDEIRELRERVHIAPTSAKYKVYIIDEVHMLTREAFNALLKTLEEPPAHCIFILATTEAHKLPETIVSRTQRFNFKAIDSSPATEHLKAIAKQEKIDISPEALTLLAEHGSGSFRDSISLLDQLSGVGGKIDESMVRDLLGLPANKMIIKLLDSIESGDTRETAHYLDELKKQGVNFALVAKALSSALRSRLIDGSAQPWVADLLRQLSATAGSANPQEALEIDVLATSAGNSTQQQHAKVPKDAIEELEAAEPTEVVEPDAPVESLNDVDPISSDFDLADWPTVVDKVKVEAASIYTALRLAEPRLTGNRLSLAFQFPLHQKKVNQAKNLQIIGDIIENYYGTKLIIECVVDKALKPPAAAAPTQQVSAGREQEASLQTINNIFGNAEVLES